MKTVLITGAASGLGKALALKYSNSSYQVCVADTNVKKGEQLAQQIQSSGGTAFFVECDITKQWDVDKLALRLAEHWRSLDVLINNAGVASAGLLDFESLEQWQWVIDINLLAHIRMTKGLIPLIRASKSSNRAIVNIASQAGLTPAPGMGSYSATKAALISFSETLYLELVHEGIHVAVVCPTFFDTNLSSSLRSDQPGMEEVVDGLMKNSNSSADQVAETVFEQVQRKRFSILTHRDGRVAHRLKRFLPMSWYLKIIKGRTENFVKKGMRGNSESSDNQAD